MSKPDDALLAKLSQLSPAQRDALLAKLKQQSAQKKSSVDYAPITPVSREQESFELSYAQRRLWFQEQLNPDSRAYHIACAIDLQGSLQSRLLERSLKQIIERHESLRTVFISNNNEIKQQVLTEFAFNLPVISIQADELAQFLENDAKQTFDLSKAPLLRCKLYQLAENHAVLSLVMHHIISDAWSSEVLLAEISHIYSALTQGAAAVLPSLKSQYIDYAAWQKSPEQIALAEQQSQFWQDKLKHCNNLALPLDKPRPAVMTQNGAEYLLRLDQALLQSFKQLCQTQQATLYHGLLAAFECLLVRYTGQNDFAIGTPIAGRQHPDTQALIGFFVNTQALPCTIELHDNFKQNLARVRSLSIEAQQHQSVPFEQLVERLASNRDASYSPIFQVFFSYQTADYHKQLHLPGLQAQFSPIKTDSAKFDLSLIINGDYCHFEFNSDLFLAPSIEQLAKHFQRLLQAICQQSELPISALPLLNRDEQAALLSTPKQEIKPYTIGQLFELQAAKTPNAVAVVQGAQQLSFLELNQKANQLAHYLLQQEATLPRFIGIAMGPCIELAIAILAVIKTGAAYLPLDPSYPSERLNHMLEHTEVNLLLGLHRRPLPALNVERLITIDVLDLSAVASHNPSVSVAIEAPLYAIFTSGSTGLPKASVISHANENNLLHWYSTQYQLNADDKFLVFSAIGFDLTQKNLLAPLCFGAQLHFCIEETYHPAALVRTIKEQQISWLNCAPSAFYPLLHNGQFEALSSLKKVFFGGEPIQMDHLAPWLASAFFNASITNMYGPTECTDIACAYSFNTAIAAPVPIGTAAANVALLVLDSSLNLVPQGACGELYIGGAGLGLGYLNNPEANQKSFIQNPFKQGQMLYKTGDLVYFNPDRQLVFVGRADGQLKIRGFRIELGEIESQLRQIAHIDDAVVCAQEIGGQTQLIAFLCSQIALEKKAYYKKQLQKHLPNYMLPVYFAAIDSIPLSPNGKVDRKQLPKISAQQLQESRECIPARSPNEKALLAIWQAVLELDNISMQDNFFELGGNSLSASQVASRIQMQFQLDLPLRSLFEINTIEGLAELISAMQTNHDVDDQDFEEGLL